MCKKIEATHEFHDNEDKLPRLSIKNIINYGSDAMVKQLI